MSRPRRWITAALTALSLPFVLLVGGFYLGAYRCPGSRECTAKVGAFLLLGLPSLFIAATLLTVALMLATHRSRRLIGAVAFVLTFALATLLFSLVWFTPHPPKT